MASLRIPTPVSSTTQRTVTLSSSSATRLARSVIEPFELNLMALPRRLLRTWRRRGMSPMTSEPKLSTSWSMKRRPFFLAAVEKRRASADRSLRSKGRFSRSSLPASTLPMSCRASSRLVLSPLVEDEEGGRTRT